MTPGSFNSFQLTVAAANALISTLICLSVAVNFVFSVVFMLGCTFAPQLYPAMLRSPINAGAFCMIAGLVIVPVVSLFTKKPAEEIVEGSFACYKKKVLVEQQKALPYEDTQPAEL